MATLKNSLPRGRVNSRPSPNLLFIIADDLEENPGEFTNLVDDPEHAETIRKLKQQLNTRMHVAGR